MVAKLSYASCVIFCMSLNSSFAGQGDFAPQRSGITGAAPLDISTNRSHPNGVNQNTFNLYTDNYGLAFYRFRADCDFTDGKFSKCSNVDRNYTDERDFSVGKKTGGNDKRYWHNVPEKLKAGDKVLLQIYVNNSGTEKVYVAKNTLVKVNFSNPNSVVVSLQSNNTTPKIIHDTVSFNLSKDLSFHPDNERYGSGMVKIKESSDTFSKYSMNSTSSMVINIGSVISSYVSAKIIYVPLIVFKK